MQLFQNLIGNAIKFASDRPPKIEISSETTASHHRFCCRDNGIGIAPEDADRIFAVFQRLHTGREVPGTGIGLAICKKVVERHGGRMWVESRPGEGATFCFTLPKAPAAPTRLESAAHPPGTDEFQFRSPIPGDAGRQ
ncbi:MAG: hypothetical protein QOD06_2448 [Candidatus Binatota bacterium]|nr:hypothetical protein [Candidatus Binatota bacterium]